MPVDPALQESLERKISHLQLSVSSDGANDSPVKMAQDPSVETFDKVLFDLQIQLKDIGLSIKTINREKEDVQVLIKQIEQWVAAAPVREAEWSSLTREYGELKRHYDFLVGQDLQARSALNLERKQKGSQFKIEDSARIPTKPVKPDFMKIMLLGLVGGCGLGGGLAFVLELLDSSFRDPDRLEEILGVEVICCVPNLSLKSELRMQGVLNMLGVTFFLCWGAVIVAAMIYFWKIGRIVLPIV